MNKLSEQRFYEFDDFRLNRDHLMLYHKGVEIPLVPKAAKTLLVLIERRGEIVSKEEMLRAVWPDTTVEESNLFAYLTLLRKTLGNQENGRPYLETLRRRGYRFNGHVRPAPGESADLPNDRFDDVPKSPPLGGERGPRTRYLSLILLGATFVAAVSATAFYWRSSDTVRGNSDVSTENRYTDSQYAYEYYLRGRVNVYKINRESMLHGIGFYEQAVQADPKFALAYAEMADAHRRLASAGFEAPTQVCPRARMFANEALRLDPSLAQAYVVLGWLDFMYEWDWSAAEKNFKRAIDLSPKDSDAYFAYAHFLSDAGRHEEAIAAIRRARELSPTNTITHAVESMIMNAAGREDEAVIAAKKALDFDLNFWPARLQLGLAYYRQKRFAEAATELERARELAPSAYQALSHLGVVYVAMGDKERAYKLLDEMEHPSEERYIPFHRIAAIYNVLGQEQKALELLERAVDERETHLMDIKVERSWDNLRSEPRFQAILRKMNLGDR
jgi:DNA-binding winged helix-turn-helix (wHTH) protein/Tfp pilus assembly protein PilF